MLTWGTLAEHQALGEPTEEDEELGGLFPDEEDVMLIAGAWSVNPQTLGDEALGLEEGVGLLGALPRYVT